MPQKYWFFYDGDCSFCIKAVKWLRTRDSESKFNFISYQSAPSPPMTPELRTACESSIHVLRDTKKTLRAGKAYLFTLQKTGLGKWSSILWLPPFIWFIEIGYFIVAKNRKFWSKLLFRHD